MLKLWKRWRAMILFLAIIVLAVAINPPTGSSGWAIYGVIAFGLLAVKGLLSSMGSDPTVEQLSVPALRSFEQERATVAVVPAFNEDPEVILACVNSCLLQPEMLGVVVIDDGSTDRAAIERIASLPFLFPQRVVRIRFDQNQGKRMGLREGVAAALSAFPEARLVATVDSDTVLGSGAVYEAAMRLYSDDLTGAVTGAVRARNWKTNVLTRIQDLRYASAFLWERAAYSRLGAVLCVCGSFTVWRRDLIEELVEILVQQKFLGKPCTYGDDRHLTNLALQRRWKIRLAERARADTLVPEKPWHWVRQQARWSKSFVRETAWAVRNLPSGWGLALTVLELVTWVGFTIALVVAVFIVPFRVGQWALASWLVWVSFMSFARSTRYFDARDDASPLDRWLSLALAPLYGIVHLVIVLPLRLWALLTLRDVAWGTRSEGVEVVEIRTSQGRRP